MGEMIGLAVVLFVVVGGVGYALSIYNGLVALRNNIGRSWANINVLLKQRHDELPKLIDTCKQYMQHEQNVLENVTKARAGVDIAREKQDIAGLSTAESALRGSLGSLFAVAENYPDLKADQGFNALQNRITGLENAIADRREFYNDSVNVNNVRVQQFPDLIVAKLFGFGTLNMLQFARSELTDVDVSKRFNS